MELDESQRRWMELDKSQKRQIELDKRCRSQRMCEGQVLRLYKIIKTQSLAVVCRSEQRLPSAMFYPLYSPPLPSPGKDGGLCLGEQDLDIDSLTKET